MNITETKKTHSCWLDTNWEVQSKGLQEQYPLLTDQDLLYETGKENELICRIQTRLNKSQEEVLNILQKELIVIA
jgi:hypothetical protein